PNGVRDRSTARKLGHPCLNHRSPDTAAGATAEIVIGPLQCSVADCPVRTTVIPQSCASELCDGVRERGTSLVTVSQMRYSGQGGPGSDPAQQPIPVGCGPVMGSG